MKRLFFSVGVLCLPLMSTFADLTVGQIYRLSFADVDGNTLSTADGHFTVVVLTTAGGVSKAEQVGDHVPDRCLGNPTFRQITVVNFQKKRRAASRVVYRAVIRRRLDAAAQRLRPRYAARNIAHDPRRDVYAVADFDGTVVAQLGARFEAGDFRVFVFAKNGELLRQWDDVPSAEDLAAVLNRPANQVDDVRK